MIATRFVQPMQFTGQYVGGSWAGYRFKDALGYTTGRHTGVDYNWGGGASDKGLPVVSIANGVIRSAQNLTTKGFGNTVIVEHPLPLIWQNELGTPSLFSRYMHLENLNYAKVGQEVSVGQKIGTCGTSGTTAYHLHLDLWKANLGAHTEYHKNTQLASYLDPYIFIEAHNKEVEEVITKNETDVLRIGHSEIGGWDVHATHRGEFDQRFLDAWNGKPVSQFIRAQWVAGTPFRERRISDMAVVPKLAEQIKSLEAEVTKRNNLLIEVQKKADLSDSLQKKIDELTAEKLKDTETGNAFVRWLGSLFNKS